MIGLEQSSMSLNMAGLEIFELCERQLRHTQTAFFSLDKDLAEKVVRSEDRVNALDLKIDRDCEGFLALHQPVAHDLRFVLGLRKINFNLERIGDHCFVICKLLSELEALPQKELIREFRVAEMFSHVRSMMDAVSEAYRKRESIRARDVHKEEQLLNKMSAQAVGIVCRRVKTNVACIDDCLLLFTVTKKLESIGDLLTSIAEEIIFYCEAEVLKHQHEKFEWD